MTDVKKMFDDAFEEQHKNDNKPAAEEAKPTEVATETVTEQSSGEGGGEKQKEQETAQAPAIDLSLLSQTIGYEVKDIEEFLRFVQISMRLLPAQSWMISGNEDIKATVHDIYRTTDKKSETSKIIFKPSNSRTIRFGICITDEQTSNGKAFSGLLRFLVHLFMIVDDEV